MSAFACRTCGCTPCKSRGFCRLCRAADRKRKQKPDQRLPSNWDEMTDGALWDLLNAPQRHGTAQSTVDAILHGVKARGVAALKEPANLERLARCDESARATVNAQISKLVDAL